MEHEQFIGRVAEWGGLSKDRADRAAHATFQTLAERITPEEAKDLAAQLPAQFKGDLEGDAAGQTIDFGEFLRRVGEREDVPPNDAHDHARAVLSTLREAVSEGEVADVVSQLPDDYATLFADPAGRLL